MEQDLERSEEKVELSERFVSLCFTVLSILCDDLNSHFQTVISNCVWICGLKRDFFLRNP